MLVPLLLALSLFALACSQGGATRAEVETAALPDAPFVLAARDAVADFDQASRAFLGAYAGLALSKDRASRERRAAAARAELAAGGAIRARDLGALLVELFGVPDGHLVVELPGRDGFCLGAAAREHARLATVVIAPGPEGMLLPEGERLEGCDVEGPLGRWLLPAPGGARLLGGYDLGPREALGCRLVRDGASRERLFPLRTLPPPPPDPGPPVELHRGDPMVLRVRTLENSATAALRELSAHVERLPPGGTVVLDVRGNPGGNFAHALPWLRALLGDDLRPPLGLDVVSPVALQGLLARAEALEAVAGGELRPHVARRVAALRDALARLDDEAPAVLRPVIAPTHRTGCARRAARVVVLVDEGCASACELLVASARGAPGVVLVGRPTRGAMAFGELGTFRLERSGMLLTFGTRAYLDVRGSFRELRGHLPDVWIGAVGGGALAEALRIAAAPFAPRPAP